MKEKISDVEKEPEINPQFTESIENYKGKLTILSSRGKSEIPKDDFIQYTQMLSDDQMKNVIS